MNESLKLFDLGIIKLIWKEIKNFKKLFYILYINVIYY